MNYYNEYDLKAVAWLEQLIKLGLIPNGDIDTRSIAEVRADDLVGYRQCHFFAGIGGWSEALRIANWPRDGEVWTGSCPCQPFSVAGKGKGEADERHLWPVFAQLIDKRRPATVFGEQVASKAGREWLDRVRLDLEAMGYAVGAADLCAASAGAPHIRQRLWWVAHYTGSRTGLDQSGLRQGPAGSGAVSQLGNPLFWRRQRHLEIQGQGDRSNCCPAQSSSNSRLGDAKSDDQLRDSISPEHGEGIKARGPSRDSRVSNAGRIGHQRGEEAERETRSLHEDGSGVCDPNSNGRQGEQEPNVQTIESQQQASRGADFYGSGELDGGALGNASGERFKGIGREGKKGAPEHSEALRKSGPWEHFDLIPCSDGKARRIERGTEPLVNGLPRGVVPSGDISLESDIKNSPEGRNMRLKGYGNAIVPQVGAEFVSAYLESVGSPTKDTEVHEDGGDIL
ncbi:DNA cytosine methyltransferase [Puniceicoccaceae bacterium K14]|nr:DNA cytosine methyltransferase [Puniceicoccaceae bacterium K14]